MNDMKAKKTVMLVFGTRPEAIKMAPLVSAFRSRPDRFNTIVTVTGQHRELLDQVLRLFEITPDYDLSVMKPGQDLTDITTRVLEGMRNVLALTRPDIVLVHGDTTTSVAAAMAAFYAQIPVGHVEAGLRTGDIYSPWPEEMNRRITGALATYHFAPTTLSLENLRKENISLDNITVTGNTVIDALLSVVNRIKSDSALSQTIADDIRAAGYDPSRLDNDKRRLVLITGHRRENFGEGFINICHAIRDLALRYPDIDFVYPMHLNPNVRKPIAEVFGKDAPANVFFTEPLDYLPFVYMMNRAYLILTDSGGIQEEAPSLGKPVLVMRQVTERPEAIAAGTIFLVGTDRNKIVETASVFINDNERYQAHTRIQNPFGDGNACRRIVSFLDYRL